MVPSLTPKEHETLVQMVAEHRKRLDAASFFTCSACSMVKHTADVEGIFPFFPKRRHKTQSFATYVICKPCTQKKPDEVYESVATYLAKQGFFINS